MKKTVLFIAFCLFAYSTKADHALVSDYVPYVKYILSNNSTVWIFVREHRVGCDTVLYRFDIDNSGKIDWAEERDSSLYCIMKNEYDTYTKNLYSETHNTQPKKLHDKSGRCWEVDKYDVYYYDSSNVQKIVYQIPELVLEISVLHVRNNGEIWFGGDDFIGYYHNEVFTRIFVMDSYKAQGTDLSICTEEKACPEEEEQEDDSDNYAEWLCFCDGRKIGYIKDSDGFVNFRTAPDISAPIIGIILDRVRVFYWDNENNGDWYRVEINGVEGYVHKSKVIIKNEENV
jgi:hypothetical protein